MALMPGRRPGAQLKRLHDIVSTQPRDISAEFSADD